MPRLILASQSPRRKALLEQLGLDFQVMPADIDETVTPGEGPGEFVRRMARQKAAAILAREPGALVLGSDTAVVLDDHIMGKPRDQADGAAMLARLSGRSHQVFSAVALAGPNGVEDRLNINEVRFRPITPAEAEAYWNTGEPSDKAGGYAIQGLGAIFVEHLAGSYSGVMGLPLFETAALLQASNLPILTPQI
ncbi:Maf family protein [Gammaproteobacteria bacterium AB-CW1]|uniref:dTTP/UTP pyrophosphatase n=1 Tax=Natronospira elongata TaxID=3110268 RepID=A0AAP6MMS5_9GAMM|nr:Maf family protein [Gammaproteobacteria bacterium AB-CW1]